jgi:UDPglucose 6-dehydrogenase
MKIGFVGLGKLGFPCALAASIRGHDVMGYDTNPAVMNNDPKPYNETAEDGYTSINTLLDRSNIRFGSLPEVLRHSELVFVAVQTPHDARYEGIARLPEERIDFNYRYLISAMRSISKAVREPKVIVIISTVLPGTIRREILPHLSPLVKICYNPFFIAMGTTIRDYLHPEFVLLGVHDLDAANTVEAYYATLVKAKIYRTSIENAELIKVAYNTFIGMKVVYANVMMEICQKMPGTDVDQVMQAIKLSTRRLISTAYLDGGMGDGGGCHPRDNIAMSWLARKLNLSFDWFESIMTAREAQAAWLAQLMEDYALPKGLVGYAFKSDTNLCVGSAALLVEAILREGGHDVFKYDPLVEGELRDLTTLDPHVFLLGARHSQFKDLRLSRGSVLLDPWRFVKFAGEGVTIVPIGRGPNSGWGVAQSRLSCGSYAL